MTELDAMDPSARLAAVEAIVLGVLSQMKIEDATPDSVLAAPRFYDAPVLIKETDRLNRFLGQFALRAGFAGYSFNDVALLSVRQLCEQYLRDSYPDTPAVPLSNDQYRVEESRGIPSRAVEAKEFPICFVLGCPRSGTTLFRTMLNVHEALWAPGELHLANYEDMADRARHIIAALRYLPVPELAARFAEPATAFSRRFRNWELERVPVSQVYEQLYEADPSQLIVDKTPSYSDRLRDMERIGQQFPNAKFVCLLRNPHDVIRSLVRMQLYKGGNASFDPGLNPYHVGEAIWSSQNSNIESFLSDIPEQRKCTLRYEELVADPQGPLNRVCELLGVSYDSRMADPYANRSGRVALGAGDMRVNFFSRVEKRAPREVSYPLGERCRSLAERCGY